jgi:hypothetical protein
MTLIGITGHPRAGKDTLAKALVLECGRRGVLAERFLLSDYLASTLRILGAMRDRDPRALQDYGADVIRRHGAEALIRALEGNITDRGPDVAIVTGVRRLAEVEWLESRGGILLSVSRQDMPPQDRDGAHEVEREIPVVMARALWNVMSGAGGRTWPSTDWLIETILNSK